MKTKQKLTIHEVLVALVLLPLAMLVGCGGNDAPQPRATPAPSSMVTGVAAQGGPITGVVALKDSSAPAVERTLLTASDGSYIFDTTGLKPPFMLKLPVGGKNLYSMASGNNGVVNINPLTTVVMSVAAGGADLDALYLSATPASLANLAANIANADVLVRNTLAAMLSLYGVNGNLLNSPFSANHTGLDTLLDGITVTISAGPGAIVTIANKATGAVIFTAPAASFATGVVVAANIPAVPVPLPGAVLYAANCSGCHGDIYTSTVSGRNAVATINNAIATDIGGMSSLSGLTAADIQNISTAIGLLAAPIAPVVATPPGGTPAGDTLYAANCASCHGALNVSAKLGATFVRVQNAISGNVGGMGRFSVLTTADIQAIVTSLNNPVIVPPPVSGVPPVPVSGATLYNTNCSGCHGPLASSSKRGITLARFNAAVANNAVTGMGYLAALSVSDVQNIVNALAITVPPAPVSGVPAGDTLYATYCSGCHGALATSAKGGATLLRIQNGIVNNPVPMGSLSTLTVQQLTDIAASLAAVTPPAVTPVPACGSCHAVSLNTLTTGQHRTHITQPKAPNLAQFQASTSCGICHGVGYSTTTVVTATHNNGVKNVDALITKWIAPATPGARGTCAPACHTPAGAKRKW